MRIDFVHSCVSFLLIVCAQNKLAKRIYTAAFESLSTKIIANDEMHKFYKQNVLKEDDANARVREKERKTTKQLHLFDVKHI